MATKKLAADANSDVREVCRNKRARRDYEIEDSFEAGMVLLGSEVKSLRAGHAHIKDAYAIIDHGEVFLIACHINPYSQARSFNHEPERRRKLLLGRHEIRRISVRVRERGQTLVPLRIYFKGHLAKVEIALVKGRAQADRRQQIRTRDLDREMAREHRRRH